MEFLIVNNETLRKLVLHLFHRVDWMNLILLLGDSDLSFIFCGVSIYILSGWMELGSNILGWVGLE